MTPRKSVEAMQGSSELKTCTFEQHFNPRTMKCECEDPNKFLDPLTGMCDPCADICINAGAQRTVELCTSMCPDFHHGTLELTTPMSPSSDRTIIIIVTVAVAFIGILGCALGIKYGKKKLFRVLELLRARLCPNKNIRQEEGTGSRQEAVPMVTLGGQPVMTTDDDNLHQNLEETNRKYHV